VGFDEVVSALDEDPEEAEETLVLGGEWGRNRGRERRKPVCVRTRVYASVV
jgi:hypothetical protein